MALFTYNSSNNLSPALGLFFDISDNGFSLVTLQPGVQWLNLNLYPYDINIYGQNSFMNFYNMDLSLNNNNKIKTIVLPMFAAA